MDDRTLALLGDKAAQERITERGELLECPFCFGKPTTRIRVKAECVEMEVKCFNCGVSKYSVVEICDTEFNKLESGMNLVIKLWNARAPILTETQLALLKIAQEPRKFREGANGKEDS